MSSLGSGKMRFTAGGMSPIRVGFFLILAVVTALNMVNLFSMHIVNKSGASNQQASDAGESSPSLQQQKRRQHLESESTRNRLLPWILRQLEASEARRQSSTSTSDGEPVSPPGKDAERGSVIGAPLPGVGGIAHVKIAPDSVNRADGGKASASEKKTNSSPTLNRTAGVVEKLPNIVEHDLGLDDDDAVSKSIKDTKPRLKKQNHIDTRIGFKKSNKTRTEHENDTQKVSLGDSLKQNGSAVKLKELIDRQTQMQKSSREIINNHQNHSKTRASSKHLELKTYSSPWAATPKGHAMSKDENKRKSAHPKKLKTENRNVAKNKSISQPKKLKTENRNVAKNKSISQPKKLKTENRNVAKNNSTSHPKKLMSPDPVQVKKGILTNQSTQETHIRNLLSPEPDQTKKRMITDEPMQGKNISCLRARSKLIGMIRPLMTEVTSKQLEKTFPWLSKGGHYTPPSCIPKEKTAIIIPFRDRLTHLHILLLNLLPVLRRQNIDFTIFVIEQEKPSLFNRGMLFNVGFVQALKLDDFDCFIFHDVDLIPLFDRNFYHCNDRPTHFLSGVNKFNYKLSYEKLFGGVVAFTRHQYEDINGASNMYFGWGAEDDDMRCRVYENNMTVLRTHRSVGLYDMIKHKGEKLNSPNPIRSWLLLSAKRRFPYDGLNTLDYELISVDLLPLYTWVKVKLDARHLVMGSKFFTSHAVRKKLLKAFYPNQPSISRPPSLLETRTRIAHTKVSKFFTSAADRKKLLKAFYPNQPSISRPPSHPKQSSISRPPSHPNQPSISRSPSHPNQSSISRSPSHPNQPSISRPPSHPNQPSISRPPSHPNQPSISRPPSHPNQPSISRPPSHPNQPSISRPPSHPHQPSISRPPSHPNQPSISRPPSHPNQPSISRPPSHPNQPSISRPPSHPHQSSISRPPSHPHQSSISRPPSLLDTRTRKAPTKLIS